MVETSFRAAFSRAQPMVGREASTWVTRAPVLGEGHRGAARVGEQVEDLRAGRSGRLNLAQLVGHPGPVGGLLGKQAGVAGGGAADREHAGRRARLATGRAAGQQPIGAGPGATARRRPRFRPSGLRRRRRRAARPPRRGCEVQSPGRPAGPAPCRPSVRGAHRTRNRGECTVRRLPPARSSDSHYCTARGRYVMFVRFCRRQDTLSGDEPQGWGEMSPTLGRP